MPPPAYQNTPDNNVQVSGTQFIHADLPTMMPLKPVIGHAGKEVRAKGHEPEVYANTALKYLNH
jgi:hypothetical protein